ncbi:MAG: lipid-A-disaccharide synthase [Planctomycetaceae bacterium]|nr:lipid-A-disaccharide synthase [Planctomycetaceae bacterium]
MKVFFSVGEPSGDLHGANLIRALRARCPMLSAYGFGGPRMRAAGAELLTELTELAVMGVAAVLPKLAHYFKLLRDADRQFQINRPDAVVLIDYPGFNWWVAARAKRHGIPVFYYSPPQVWGWAQWRVAKMRRYVDHVLCGMQFEADWFRQHSCNATFIGHPYFDEVRERTLDAEFVEQQRARGPLVTLLPGSRSQEVKHNLPAFLHTAAHILREQPETQFAVAAFKEKHAEQARRLVNELRLPVEVHVGRTPELIEAATCCLACSGSVSLELLYHAKPTVVHYRIDRLWYFIQSRMRKTRYFTLGNLMNDPQPFVDRATEAITAAASDMKVLFPEFLSIGDRSAELARPLVRWLREPELRESRVRELQELLVQVGQPGATSLAADYLLQTLNHPLSGKRRPHFTGGMKVSVSTPS